MATTPSLTGTPDVLQFAAGTVNPAAQSVTIPAGTTAVYMLWQFYNAAAGNGLSSVTLAGANPNQTVEVATAPTDQEASGCAVWYNPPTGPQNLQPVWDIAPTDPTVTVVYVKDCDTTSWRDAQVANESGATATSVTLTTAVDDLVLAYDTHFSSTIPTNPAGWTSQQTEGAGTTGQTNRTRTIVATGTTQAVTAQEPAYSTIVGIAIPPVSATNASPVPPGAAGTSAAGLPTALPQPPVPYTLTTVTG